MMFRVILFTSLIVVLSCKTLKPLEQKPECPKGFECKSEIMNNKSITILDDSIGKLYPKFENSEDYNVFKYTYIYEGRPEIADDSYEEAIYFQIPKDSKSLNIKDKELSEVKMLVQKSCFCRDAGYELVSNGNLKLEKLKNSYNIQLEFVSKRNLKVKNLETNVKF